MVMEMQSLHEGCDCMLLIQDKIVKLGGVLLHGQVQSIEISAEASIEDIKPKKGKTKKNQPTGYEAAKVRIEILLENTKKKNTTEMLQEMQRLFRKHGQKKAKLLKIVNTDCAARGISKVYFQNLTSTKVISESKRTVSLELLAPRIAGLKVKKKKPGKSKNAKNKKSSTAKTTKDKKKSPAQDTRKTEDGKKKAKGLVK